VKEVTYWDMHEKKKVSLYIPETMKDCDKLKLCFGCILDMVEEFKGVVNCACYLEVSKNDKEDKI